MPSPTRRRPSSSCVESAGEVWCVSELIVVCNGDVVSWGTGERLAPGFGIFGGRVGWGCRILGGKDQGSRPVGPARGQLHRE